MSDLVALRAFLAHARSRTDPRQFPVLRSMLDGRDPRGRRLPGVTQAHMDILLGRAPGTYERLERGVTVRPALLESVAQILALTEDEWRAAHRYAFSTAPPRPLTRAAGKTLPGEWQAALDSLAPAAYILDDEGFLVAYNDGFRAYFGDGPVPRNVLRWGLTDPTARNVLLDWHSAWAPGLCGQLRAALASIKDSEVLNALRAEVLENRETAQLLESTARAGASTTPQSNRPRPVRHPELGPGWVTMCAASPADSPGTRLTIAPFYQGQCPAPREPISA